MATNVFVALWRVKTNADASQQDRDRALNTKITDLRVKAQNTLQTLDGVAATNQGVANPIFMFLAPEYYFEKRSDKNILQEKQKNTIVDSFKNFTAARQRTLVFPGTIMWKSDRDLLQKATLKKAIAHNTAYVFADGNIVFTYNKQKDAGEVSAASAGNAVFVTDSGLVNYTFLYQGVNFALEICADHDARVAVKSALGGAAPQLQDAQARPMLSSAQRAAQNIDIHVVLSYGQGAQPGAVIARDGGFAVVSDGQTSGTFSSQAKSRYPSTGVFGIQSDPTKAGEVERSRRYSLSAHPNPSAASQAQAKPFTINGLDSDVSAYYIQI